MSFFTQKLQFLANVNSHSRSLFAIVHPSACLSSVMLVRPTQAVQIFRNISTAFGTEIIPGGPVHGGVKYKRGSHI